MRKSPRNLVIKQFVSKTGKNQYLLTSADEAAVIDVSESYDELCKILDHMEIELKYLLITHAHQLHLKALPDMKRKYGGTFCLHEYEYELLKKSESHIEPDRFLKDKEILQLGDIEIEVLLTAGHTKGHVCFYVKKADALFSGSSFLKRGYGKIWGPKSMSLMLFSLKRLSYNIPPETTIYTGSGDLTTMENEGGSSALDLRDNVMLSSEQEAYILTHAYVPEHTVVLMTSLSGGEPFLIDDYFCCCKDDWVIFIGYPLKHEFVLDKFEGVLKKVKKKFRAVHISLIAPELPKHLGAQCLEKDSDTYYILNTRNYVIGSAVKRNIRKAALLLTVERAVHMGDAHHELIEEFLQRVSPPLRVKELFLKMPQYVSSAGHAFVLNAWDPKQNIVAFYVVDFTVRDFANYIIGCYSKNNYILGASDLLLSELIKMSKEYSKRYIHLGLGVNSGIRRFKEKWGAKPTLSYEMCELVQKKSSILEVVHAMRKFKSR